MEAAFFPGHLSETFEWQLLNVVVAWGHDNQWWKDLKERFENKMVVGSFEKFYHIPENAGGHSA